MTTTRRGALFGDPVLSISLAGFAALLALPWLLGVVSARDLFAPQGVSGARGFLDRAADLIASGAPLPAAREVASATVDTLALALAAIGLAGGLGAVLSALASREILSPAPYVPDPRPPALPTAALCLSVRASTRAALGFLRSLPEYLLAFLLVGTLGPSPWAIALAVGLHNLGVVARLFAEGIDHTPKAPAVALRALGARRRHLLAFAIAPSYARKGLALVFYRLEMCVRESSVLGVLGISSLGFLLDEARVRGRADLFLLLSLCCAAVVIAVDQVSRTVRARLGVDPKSTAGTSAHGPPLS